MPFNNAAEDDWGSIPQGEFITFEPGVPVAGTITAKAVGSDFNGNPCPQLSIRTPEGTDHKINAGQANLKAQLMALKPNVGDRIEITWSSNEKAAKGEKKIFTIRHEAATAAAGPKW